MKSQGLFLSCSIFICGLQVTVVYIYVLLWYALILYIAWLRSPLAFPSCFVAILSSWEMFRGQSTAHFKTYNTLCAREHSYPTSLTVKWGMLTTLSPCSPPDLRKLTAFPPRAPEISYLFLDSMNVPAPSCDSCSLCNLLFVTECPLRMFVLSPTVLLRSLMSFSSHYLPNPFNLGHIS